MPISFLLIAPGRSDTLFDSKMEIAARIATEQGVSNCWPIGSAQRHGDAAIEALKSADVIVADLSLARPSCYFEIGLAQGLGKRVELIASTGTEIHQVLGPERVRFYSTLGEYAAAIRKSILSACAARDHGSETAP